jgi:serine/threonine protein kinase
MGRVWIAEHLTLDTNVVVKFMASDIAATADGAARFAREASVAAAVKSPHVVQVFDHGVTPDGDAYIVMELLEGRDLAAQLAQGPMAPRDVAALVAQVAKALGKAHQVGVVHRDIKPDNIFLCDADGGELFVKLLDFGIAKRDQHRVAGAATTTGAVIGTPYYMSPEQIVGDKEIDARTDIWSLGVVGFEAMTGKRPFEGTTVGAITLAIHTGTRRITDHLPSAPVALDVWFSKACARDPKERFQNAREASNALLQAVGELPASVPLLRAPMPSMVGDSDPSMASMLSGEAPSDGRVATHLSSAFPVPRPSRKPPVLLFAGIGAVLVLGGAMLAVPALLRPRETPTNGSGGTPSLLSATSATSATAATSSDSTGTNAVPIPADSGRAAGNDVAAAASASQSPAGGSPPAVAASQSAARAGGVVPSRQTGAGGTTPRTTTPGKSNTPAKPTKPGRTRDDDDIK